PPLAPRPPTHEPAHHPKRRGPRPPSAQRDGAPRQAGGRDQLLFSCSTSCVHWLQPRARVSERSHGQAGPEAYAAARVGVSEAPRGGTGQVLSREIHDPLRSADALEELTSSLASKRNFVIASNFGFTSDHSCCAISSSSHSDIVSRCVLGGPTVSPPAEEPAYGTPLYRKSLG